MLRVMVRQPCFNLAGIPQHVVRRKGGIRDRLSWPKFDRHS